MKYVLIICLVICGSIQAMEDGNNYKIVTDDNQEFTLLGSILKPSETIRIIIDDNPHEESYPIPNISGTTFTEILKALAYIAEHPMQDSAQLSDNIPFKITSIENIITILKAANYLDIPPLLLRAEKALAHAVQDEKISWDDLSKQEIPKELRSGINKYYYLRYGKQASFEPFAVSVKELLAYNRIPSIKSNQSSLDLSGKHITNLDGLESIPNVGHIRVLKLNNNAIGHMKAGLFDHFSNLNMLNLSHNHLYSIDNGSLDPLKNLSTLQLDHNRLTEIDAQAFESLSKLTTLILRSNPLRTILHIEIFKNLGNLVIIGVDATELPSEAQEFIQSVKRLHGGEEEGIQSESVPAPEAN